jgi:hypothetical protein
MNLKSLFARPNLLATSAARPNYGKVERRQAMVADANKSRFHCVEVKATECICDAVQRIEGRRFLSEEAPMLPLPDCTAGICCCRYEHHDDRRQDLRRNPYGIQRAVPPPHVDEDRRASKERRGKRT